jgi:hypothetical protein
VVLADTSAIYSLAWFTAPTVALTSTAPADVLRDGTTPLTFTFTRSGGDLSLPLTVPLITGGTATAGSHYQPAVPASITFAANVATAELNLTPLATADPGVPPALLTLALGTDFASAVDPTLNNIAVTLHARPYGLWRAARFTSVELSDPLVSGDNADPDHDAVTNLMEYGLGLEPKSADPVTSAPIVGAVDDHVTLTYTRPTSLADISYTVEWSGDLQTWSTGSGATELVSTTDNGNGTTTVVTRTTATLGSTPRQFLRLRITRL